MVVSIENYRRLTEELPSFKEFLLAAPDLNGRDHPRGVTCATSTSKLRQWGAAPFWEWAGKQGEIVPPSSTRTSGRWSVNEAIRSGRSSEGWDYFGPNPDGTEVRRRDRHHF